MITLEKKINVLRFAFRDLGLRKPTLKDFRDFTSVAYDLGIRIELKKQEILERKIIDYFGEDRSTEVFTKSVFELTDDESGDSSYRFEVFSKGRAYLYDDHLTESDRNAMQNAQEKAFSKLINALVSKLSWEEFQQSKFIWI